MARAQRKTSRGRQKIEMVKIKNEAHLYVSFSKRRSSIFRYGSEINALTGAQVAILVFSPGNRLYSFGCPDVPSVVNRFLNPGLCQDADPFLSLQRMADLENLTKEITFLNNMLEEEKRRGQDIDRRIAERQSKCKYWWEESIEELSFNQLLQLRMALLNLREMVLWLQWQHAQIHDVPNLPPTVGGGTFLGGDFSSTIPQNYPTGFLDMEPVSFGVSQGYSTGPPQTNGEVFMNDASSLMMAGSGSNQMDNSGGTIGMAPVTVGAGLEHATPSRIDIDSQENGDGFGFSIGYDPSDEDDWFKCLFD